MADVPAPAQQYSLYTIADCTTASLLIQLSSAQWGSDEEEDWEEVADKPLVLANPTSMKGPYHQELMCLLKRAVEKQGIDGLQQCT